MAKGGKRKRTHIDIDERLQRHVKDLARETGIPESQIYALFTAEGLIEAKKGHGSLWNRLRRSSSPRFKYNVDLEDLLNLLDDIDK